MNNKRNERNILFVVGLFLNEKYLYDPAKVDKSRTVYGITETVVLIFFPL